MKMTGTRTINVIIKTDKNVKVKSEGIEYGV